MMNEENTVRSVLNHLMALPSIAGARLLEQQLTEVGCRKMIFGRINQKSSIEAASESDRGVVERITNAFDASVIAARRIAGIQTDPKLTPRKAVQRFLNPNQDACAWDPQSPEIDYRMPVIQFWREEANAKRRFKRYQAESGLCTFLVRDTSLGMERKEMTQTILDLNSGSKLRIWEAIGQFGHGGSSALAFCESCLVITQPRFSSTPDEFYWTLIFPEAEADASKQAYVVKWFADQNGLPLVGKASDFPSLADVLPGTSIWHFGYDRGDWLKTATGTHQDTPAGRLGRLLFSYPLPFQIHGEFARGETDSGTRTVKGAFFRLMDERAGGKNAVEYRTGEKSERLIINNEEFGQFNVFAFVLSQDAEVRNYVHQDRPVILTLHGQNHGEIRRTLLIEAGYTELASSMIVEIRLDGLDNEALREIINNSRETPKTTVFTKTLKQRVEELLRDDEVLASIERRRQEERTRRSSGDLSQRITKFLSSIISDAKALPSERSGSGAPGEARKTSIGPKPRPEIPAADPPRILEFIGAGPLFVPEASASLAKFKSDARPPKYSFHGDNPRCFARLEVEDQYQERIVLTGKADISKHGYGSVTLTAIEPSGSCPVEQQVIVGKLYVTIQAADGRLLEAALPIGLCPKPKVQQRRPQQSVRLEISFCAPDGSDIDELKSIFGEEKISSFGQGYLGKYRDALAVSEQECAYWGEKSDIDEISKLVVEINAAHPRLKRLLQACTTVEERIRTKERIVQDIVLDCYQHSFRLEDVPDGVHEQIFADSEDAGRAAEICLNFDKALRMVASDKVKDQRN